ncbi:hypothetical protein AgCh_028267 [Apium graveolens]
MVHIPEVVDGPRTRSQVNKIENIPNKNVVGGLVAAEEKKNVPYVVENGAGVFTRSSREIARLVAEWFSTKSDEL